MEQGYKDLKVYQPRRCGIGTGSMQDAAAGGRKQFRDCQVLTAAAYYVFGSMANNPEKFLPKN